MNYFDLKKQYRYREHGFTLMELVTVIGIIGILSAIVIPMFLNPEHRVKKVARAMHGDMEKVKILAVKNNTSHRMVFGADGYTIRDDGGNILKTVRFVNVSEGVGYGSGSATVTANSVPTVNLPADGIGYAGDLVFNPRGTCTGGYVYLVYRDVVYAVGTTSTGFVKIRRWTGGAWR